VTFLPHPKLKDTSTPKCSVAREKMGRIQRNRSLGWQRIEFQGASGTEAENKKTHFFQYIHNGDGISKKSGIILTNVLLAAILIYYLMS
jgi:hypothetical protein